MWTVRTTLCRRPNPPAMPAGPRARGTYCTSTSSSTRPSSRTLANPGVPRCVQRERCNAALSLRFAVSTPAHRVTPLTAACPSGCAPRYGGTPERRGVSAWSPQPELGVCERLARLGPRRSRTRPAQLPPGALVGPRRRGCLLWARSWRWAGHPTETPSGSALRKPLSHGEDRGWLGFPLGHIGDRVTSPPFGRIARSEPRRQAVLARSSP